MRHNPLISAIAAAFVCLSAPARASNSVELNPDLRATILMRAMAYERNLTQRQTDLKLVVIAGSTRASAQDAEAMRTALAALAGRMSIAGRHLTVGEVVTADASLIDALKKNPTDIVYASTGLTDFIHHNAAAITGLNTVILCTDASDVGSGCLLALEEIGGKPHVVVDLGLTRRMGLNFDSRLLQLSRVVE